MAAYTELVVESATRNADHRTLIVLACLPEKRLTSKPGLISGHQAPPIGHDRHVFRQARVRLA